MPSDGNIRYFEYENDKFEYLSEYKSPDPQRGIAFMPKRGIDVHQNEVLRCYKTVNDSYIQPISFVVPRRAEMFQSDIYPPTTGLKPGTTSEEWFIGQTALPPKISLESVYEGAPPEEVDPARPSASTAPVQSPPPTKAEPPKPTPAPAPAPASVASRGPPPSVNENKASLADQASKFADENESEPESDDSFEEVDRPVERHPAAKQEEMVKSPVVPEPKPVAAPAAAPAASAAIPPPTTPVSQPIAASSANSGLKEFMHEIKSYLQHQNKMMTEQSERIALLMREVSSLKAKIGSQAGGTGDREKDERIRELELELEEARS